VTEDMSEHWLAAHYGIQSHDKLPLTRPNEIPKQLYDRLKERQRKNQKTALTKKQRELEMEERQAAKNLFAVPCKTEHFDKCQHSYSFQTSPVKFQQVTYPKEMRVRSLVDTIIE
jgi:hypothetical protein